MPDKPPVPTGPEDDLTVDPKAGETVRPDWAYDSCDEPAGGKDSSSGASAGTPHNG